MWHDEQDAGVPCPDTSGAVWTISVVSSTNATQPAVQALLAGQIESTRSTRGNLYHSVVRTAHPRPCSCTQVPRSLQAATDAMPR